MNNKYLTKELGYDTKKVNIDESDNYINIKVNNNLYIGIDEYCNNIIFCTNDRTLLHIILLPENNEIIIEIPFILERKHNIVNDNVSNDLYSDNKKGYFHHPESVYVKEIINSVININQNSIDSYKQVLYEKEKYDFNHQDFDIVDINFICNYINNSINEVLNMTEDLNEKYEKNMIEISNIISMKLKPIIEKCFEKNNINSRIRKYNN